MKDKIIISFIFLLIVFGSIFLYTNIKNSLNATDNNTSIINIPSDNIVSLKLEIITSDNTVTSYNVLFKVGTDLYKIFNDLSRTNSDFTFETDTSSFGKYLTSINGIKTDPSKEFWNIKSNGNDTTFGISDFFPQKDDQITLSLLTF